MNKPTSQAIVFFLGALGVGYAISVPFLTGFLGADIGLESLANLTAFAFLFAVVMTAWLDRPFELGLFKWPEKKPEEKAQTTPPPPQPAAPAVTPEIESHPAPSTQPPEIPSGTLFPHEIPSEHWNADFGDSKQVYQGSDLPVWILAGWAIFIIWAIVYLVFGLPTAF